MSSNKSTIPVPTYAMDDDALLALAERLHPFAIGDEDYTDEPCARAQTAIDAIKDELEWRGGTVVLWPDGSITMQPATPKPRHDPTGETP